MAFVELHVEGVDEKSPLPFLIKFAEKADKSGFGYSLVITDFVYVWVRESSSDEFITEVKVSSSFSSSSSCIFSLF
jgi:hypothetical protein